MAKLMYAVAMNYFLLVVKYDQLISNENLHFEIWRAKWILKDLQLNYLQTLEKADEIIFIKGRLKFGNSKNSAPFPSAIVVFNSPDIITVKE